jgi:hypothetical protein
MARGLETTPTTKEATLTFKFRNLKYMQETSNSIARIEEHFPQYSLEMVQFIWENGNEESGQERGTRNGQMGLNTLEIGGRIKQTGLESCSILMGMSMKAVGSKIKRMERESISTLMEQFMKANGCKISSTDWEWKSGQMEPSMKGSSLRGGRKGRES